MTDRTVRTALLVIMASTLAGVPACTPSDPAGDSLTMSATAETTELRYEHDTLHVDGVALTQFPGYKADDFSKGPPDWPTEQVLNIGSATDYFEHPTVNVAVLTRDPKVDTRPEKLIDIADRDTYEKGNRRAAENSTNGGGRACTYRVTLGTVGVEADMQDVPQGTIIAQGPGKATIGIVVFGASESATVSLMKSIVGTICPS